MNALKPIGNKVFIHKMHIRSDSSWAPYTECPRRNVPDFGRMFLMLKYNDITQNTYIQSWTVTEIMAREKCGLLAVPRNVPVQLTRYLYTAHVRPWQWNAVNIAAALRTVVPSCKNAFCVFHLEYCDMYFVYGFCDGNARTAVEEYQRRFPDRRIPSTGVFTRNHQALRETGCLLLLSPCWCVP